jgi:hypothetical protein
MKTTRKNLRLTKKALFVYNQKSNSGQKLVTEDPITVIMPITSIVRPD